MAMEIRDSSRVLWLLHSQLEVSLSSIMEANRALEEVMILITGKLCGEISTKTTISSSLPKLSIELVKPSKYTTILSKKNGLTILSMLSLVENSSLLSQTKSMAKFMLMFLILASMREILSAISSSQPIV
jgi:hypothetical protein